MFRHHYSSGICTNIYSLHDAGSRIDLKNAIQRIKEKKDPTLRHWEFNIISPAMKLDDVLTVLAKW